MPLAPWPVSCSRSRGRGRRRVRVSEVADVLRAEDFYTALLEDPNASLRPGARGTFEYVVLGERETAAWECVPNAVWTFGRVFFLCPRCAGRCTRLYVPCRGFSPFACRTCCGLTYASRAGLNYKDSVWGRGLFARIFGTTHREYAYEITADRRSRRRRLSAERWAKRRPFLLSYRLEPSADGA